VHVLSQVLKNSSAAGIAALLFDLSEAAQGKDGGAPCFFRRHSPRDVFADLSLEMFAKLISHPLLGRKRERIRSGNE